VAVTGAALPAARIAAPWRTDGLNRNSGALPRLPRGKAALDRAAWTGPMMQAEETAIPAVKILMPKKHSDAQVFLKYSRAAWSPDRRTSPRSLAPTPCHRDSPPIDLAQQRAGNLVNFVFTLRRTPSEHEAQERRRCDRLLSFARSLSA
jgi:hypothetical protein